MCVEKNRES